MQNTALSKVSIVALLVVLACAPSVWAASGGQASITLSNSDLAYCHKQDAIWNLTTTNNAINQPVNSGTTVNWSIAATKSLGAKTVCATGYVSVQNTGSAPATIGNIVVNLQRSVGGNKWKEISADVANAAEGDAATSVKIAAGALQGQTTYPDVVVYGQQATIAENAISGSLQFTDAENNTVWALNPAKIIPVGATVNLFFEAVFHEDQISPALASGESLRAEVLVTFGGVGPRGGSGASAPGIDINGNGAVDPDEAYVRTVATRVTRPIPALVICNDAVTITDTFGATDGASVTLTEDPIGAGVTTTTSQTYLVTGTVAGNGTVTNTATLYGTDTIVTVTVGTDSSTGLPITADRNCCIAVQASASSSVAVDTPKPAGFISYTQGAYGAEPNGHNPASLLASNFGTYFLYGLLIGAQPQYNAQWTSQAAVQAFLPAGGPSRRLTANLVNPTTTAGGTLAGQVTALTLNVVLGQAGLFSPYPGIGNLVYNNPTDSNDALNGYTVSQILAVANTALGTGVYPAGYGTTTTATNPHTGVTTTTIDLSPLNDLITLLNESWDNGTQSAWATTHLK